MGSNKKIPRKLIGAISSLIDGCYFQIKIVIKI